MFLFWKKITSIVVGAFSVDTVQCLCVYTRHFAVWLAVYPTSGINKGHMPYLNYWMKSVHITYFCPDYGQKPKKIVSWQQETNQITQMMGTGKDNTWNSEWWSGNWNSNLYRYHGSQIKNITIVKHVSQTRRTKVHRSLVWKSLVMKRRTQTGSTTSCMYIIHIHVFKS